MAGRNHSYTSRLTRPRAPRVVTGLVIICCAVILSGSPTSCRATEFLGLRLGMTPEEVRETFAKAAIPVSEESSDVLSAPRPPTGADGVKLLRLFFEKGKLNKLSVRFALPVHEPDAANFIALFDKMKAGIINELGHPTFDVVQMKAPAPQDRYDWLKRGNAYYQTIWKTDNGLKVTLWLYGEDTDVVLLETYESQDRQ